MSTDQRAALARIRRFDQLIAYLRDELDWPIGADDFEDLTFEYTPEELGIDAKNAAIIETIRRLRPLATNQPWGIFFVKFEPKRLPVVALRRILSKVALKKRASANSTERQAWAADDLLFISNYGEGDQRQISFAHFSSPHNGQDLPTLKVLGWDNLDTALHLDAVAKELTEHLTWPGDETNVEAWRARWRAAFTLGHREVITTSRDLSIRLAELARVIRDRTNTALAIETDRGPLTTLMTAFRQAIVHDLDAGDFADTYAQTIAYGLLSARIVDPHTKTADDFAGHLRTNPFLRELMETFLQVGGQRGQAGGPGIDFDELGVSEVVELLDGANMEAVVADFGDRNPQEDPVIHFYELFLKAYDAKKRMQRGVFYTPRQVVSYIVRSVDELLRTEFDLQDGLADTTTWGEMAGRRKDLEIPPGLSPEQEFVQILDPATGTGTFLVEIVDVIHKTLVAKWLARGEDEGRIGALWNEYVPRHLLPRLHGFELLMAPYAIAHLKLGLKLHETGYLFASEERARIYLTNTLEPAHDFSGRFEFAMPALAHEAQAVNEIKRNQCFTIVIGNPPYAGVSSNMTEYAQRLVEAYKVVDGAALNERKLWLQDDYVKFIRYGQTVVERAGLGILGYVTNHGYLDNPTFRGMRQSLISSFDYLHLFDLHGNALKKERAPDGSDDKNVFEIRQGVAICIGAHRSHSQGTFRGDLWGTTEMKYNWLESHSLASTDWRRLKPASPFYFFSAQESAAECYDQWTPLSELMPTYSSGVITARDELVLDIEAGPILDRVRLLRDPQMSDDALRRQLFEGKGSPKYPAGDSRGWRLPEARRKLRQDAEWQDRVATCQYRPFDRRRVYLTEWMVDWSRPELRRHLELSKNPLLVFPRNTGAGKPWDHAFVSYEPILGRFFPDSACITYMAPALLVAEGMLGYGPKVTANTPGHALSSSADSEESAIRRLGLQRLSYFYAVLYSPTYRDRYVSQLRADFPRIPTVDSPEMLLELSRLGGELVALHLMESPKLENLITTYRGPNNPEVDHVGWVDDVVWLDASTTKRGHPPTSGTVGFHGVPEEVWRFSIGGYQVCEKWLTERKGRSLSDEDLAYYQKIVVALAETMRLMKEIDDVIEAHGGWPGAFLVEGIETVGSKVIPFRPHIVRPSPAERYAACAPLVPLKVAAGAFGDTQHIEEDDFEWVALDSAHRLRPGMFVAQVVGKSMEPAIPDGSYCLFSAPVAGSRVGKTVLVQLRDGVDPDTGERYTVKRYDSQKDWEMEGLWQHRTISLRPNNPDFQPIVLTSVQEGDVKVIAELVEVLHGDA